MFNFFSALRKALTTILDNSQSEAFMMAAFSRSISPMRPISPDRVSSVSGASFRMISAIRRSISELIGVKTAERTADLMPLAFMSLAPSITAFSSSGAIVRPSNS